MAELNLVANGKSQELILAYLQENASDVLAEKINNGVPVEKDGKQLISKKDLNGFMTYANGEARKLAEKGANSACVEDAVVYGWAIHYFEEDGIAGKLFNADGTEYFSPKTTKKTTTAPAKAEPPKPKQQQASLWDMIVPEEKKTVSEQDDEHEVMDLTKEDSTTPDIAEELDEPDPSVDEIADALQKAIDAKNAVQSEKVVTPDGKTIDTATGEVLCEDIDELTAPEMRQFDGDIQEPKEASETDSENIPDSFSPSSFDEDTAIYLLKLLDGKMDLA